MISNTPQGLPGSGRLEDFDRQSGQLLERLLFNHRPVILLLCAIVTAFLGFEVSRLDLNANFEAMIPVGHPFIRNYLAHQDDLQGQGNTMEIVVEAKHGTILDAHYLDVLQHINDEVFLLPGVNRPYMKSIWTPATRWTTVTPEGFDGGPVIPNDYDGSKRALDELRTNLLRSGEIGQLIAPDFKSSVVLVPLLDINSATGKQLDYGQLSRELDAVRAKYSSPDIAVHITGFAKIMGDLITALHEILLFFALSITISLAMVYWYTRCWRSTALVVACSLIAVTWQLGILPLLGFSLDPYSVLVPFLVFAIGMSHGAQKMNGVMQDIGRGAHRLVAARYTFRRLFVAGFSALMCDAVGFAVLLVIRIEAIQRLALIASIGVAILVFTNLILLPILLSYVGVDSRAAARSLKTETDALQGATKARLWRLLDLFTTPRYAAAAILGAILLGIFGFWVGQRLQIGDLDPGAPELRANSVYNRDNAYLTGHYATSSDVFVVMVTTPQYQCGSFKALQEVDRLEWQLRGVPGVEATNSAADLARQTVSDLNEGNFKWYEIIPNQGMLDQMVSRAPRELFNQDCNFLTLYVYLKDHKAATLNQVVDTVQQYANANDSADAHFLLAAGNDGIEAATNQVVGQANHTMLFYIYGAVILMSLITFRSWRVVVVAVLPLVLTSLLAQALMVWLGIGVKVATLPVTALGVGIGVDYALYILSVTLARMREGASLSEAYYRALLFTGKVVMLTGFTLAAAVITWAFSPIKFQADMGVLLAFMFLWNMLGALILLPALGCFLLKKPRIVKAIRPVKITSNPARHEETMP
jgi:uncharacterized protein